MFRLRVTIGLMSALAVCTGAEGPAAEPAAQLRAGFSAVDITPPLGSGEHVYLAGYGMNRKATGVHDPLYARTVVLADGDKRIAISCVDLIGLQHPQVQEIRQRLPGFRYVMVSSTHNHEGPDVIGIWGRGPFHRGVSDEYLDLVVERVVQSVKEAAENLAPVTAAFGTAEDETLLSDSRLPVVKDGVLRAVRLNRAGSGEVAGLKVAGLIVQWNSHPESLGSRNKLITADFPWAAIAALTAKYNCPVVYLSGAVGGLMSNPSGRIIDDAGKELPDGTFDYAQAYGRAVAKLAEQAIAAADPVQLTPISVSSKKVSLPVHNWLYRAARSFGVMKRDAFLWTGDAQSQGDPMTRENADQESAIGSEVACLRLGELFLACIPGELYPELVYGKFQEPVEPNADFPNSPLEPTIASLFEKRKWMLIGLANDEVGYIIPKRQWDKSPPYAYGREGGQYGEVNSCSPEVAPIVMDALQDCIAEFPATPTATDRSAAPLSNPQPIVYASRRAAKRAANRPPGWTTPVDHSRGRTARCCRRATGYSANGR
jgi:hypothetical protein